MIEANVDDEGLLQHQIENKTTPPVPPMIPPAAAAAVSIIDDGGGHTDYINRAFYFPK